MSDEWLSLPLESCMDAIIDYRGKSPAKTTSGVPLVTARIVKSGRILPPDEFIAEKDFVAWMRRGIPAPGDVVMTTEAPLGEVAQLDGRRIALAQRVITLRGKPHLLDNTFLKFLMQSEPVQEELRNRSTGTTVLGIRQSELRKVTLRLPPLPEQKRIAHILGTLDDKIDLNRRMNVTLEGISRAIFKSWFVDFDPVRQKAAGKQPVGMDAKTAALFPDSFEDSEIGEVPRGWTVGSILEQASLLSGGTPKTDEPSYWGGSVPWASAKDVSQCGDVFLVATERTITQLGVDRSATKIIPANTTVVVSRGATTGRLAMFAHDMAMNQTCYGLHSRLNAPYSLYCNTRSFIDRMVNAAHGSVFDTITTRTFETTPVLLVPQRNLTAFESTAADLFGQVRTNIIQSSSLAALRDTLLPKLLSGAIRVPEAEEAVEEALG